MNIQKIFENFKLEYKNIYTIYDGINGYCSVFAYYLYKYFLEKGILCKIYCLNKDIHFWIEINDYYIDSRGVFIKKHILLNPFKKYIVSERISEVSIESLYNYITKRFGKIL